MSLQEDLHTESLRLIREEALALPRCQTRFEVDQCRRAFHLLHRHAADTIGQRHGLPGLLWRTKMSETTTTYRKPEMDDNRSIIPPVRPADSTAEAQARLTFMTQLDISNEAWRKYHYPDGSTFLVEDAITLILEKRPDGDRHRLIVRSPLKGGREIGMYITPGWKAISWQTPDGKHGITF